MKLQKLLNGRSPESSPISFDASTIHMNRPPFTTVSLPIGPHHRLPPQLSPPPVTSASLGLRPTQMDVLFGRGKPYQGHPGNIRLHKVVEMYRDRYSDARRHIKTEIAEEIVEFIKHGGAKPGRFLKRRDGDETWVEVSDAVARDKVSHALRGKARKEDKDTDEEQFKALTEGIVNELKTTKRSAEIGQPATTTIPTTTAEAVVSDAAIADALSQQASKKRRIEEFELDCLALASRRNHSMMMPYGGSSAVAGPTPGNVAFPTGGGNFALPADVRSQLVAAILAERRLTLEMSLRGLLQHHPTPASAPLIRNGPSLPAATLLQSLTNNGQTRFPWY